MATENRKDVQAGIRLDPELLDKLKAIAYWERKTFKEVVSEGLEAVVKKYEKTNGPVKPAPVKK